MTASIDSVIADYRRRKILPPHPLDDHIMQEIYGFTPKHVSRALEKLGKISEESRGIEKLKSLLASERNRN